MSDFILKLFPVEEVATDKTTLIKDALMKAGVLSGEEGELDGEWYGKPGDAFGDYFEFEEEETAKASFGEVQVKVVADGYGVAMEEEDEEPSFVDRKNVVELWQVDGNYTGWEKLTSLLTEVTGDNYTGEWEIL